MTEEELKVLFENNSNCYTEVLTNEGEFEEMAITFDVFVRLVKILNIPVVTNRTFKCSRCETVYTLMEGVHIGCCTMPTEYRTSGICGGELIEIVT